MQTKLINFAAVVVTQFRFRHQRTRVRIQASSIFIEKLSIYQLSKKDENIEK